MKLVLLISAVLASASPCLSEESASTPGGEASRNNACIQCHENLPGRLSGVVEQWRRSVHRDNSVFCENCHGGDPTVRRDQFDDEGAFKKRSHLERDNVFFALQRSSNSFVSAARGRSVSYFCGKCHANIKEKHLGSPHGDLGEPSCLYCHGGGSHAIQQSSVDIIDPRPRSEGGRCAACHRAATMEAVANIKTILVNAEKQLAAASQQYAWLEQHGYKNLMLEKMYHHSKETLSQLRQTFHSFNMREINNFASAIKSNADLTQQTYELIVRLERARIQQAQIGAGAVVFLLSFAALLLYYKKTVLHHTRYP